MKAISRNPDILGGTPVFSGTRVPVRNLLDYLEEGNSVEEFMDSFPSVAREQVIDVLEHAFSELTDFDETAA